MKNELRYFSMFSGVGGFEVAIDNAFRNQEEQPICVGYSEIDKHSLKVLKYHFGGILWSDVQNAVKKATSTSSTSQLVKIVFENTKESGDLIISNVVVKTRENTTPEEEKKFLENTVGSALVVEKKHPSFSHSIISMGTVMKKEENMEEQVTPTNTSLNKDVQKTNTNSYVITAIWQKGFMENVHIHEGEEKYGKINYHDATTINPSELPDFDLLVGGFPCQAFSVAGRRKGFEDTRGTLFFDVARIARAKRPQHLVLENVKGLLNHEKGDTFATILATLQELGYDVEWGVVNTRYFGVPQNRERVYIIGHLGGCCSRKVFPQLGTDGEDTEPNKIVQLNHPKHSQQRVYSPEGLSPTIAAGNLGGGKEPCKIVHGTITEAIGRAGSSSEYIRSIEAVNQARAVLTPDRANKQQNGRRMKNPDEPSFTVTGQDIHGVAVHKADWRVYDRYNNKVQDIMGTLDLPHHSTWKLISKPAIIHNLYGGFGEGIRVFDEYSPTNRTAKGGGHLPSVLNETRIRRLTPRECHRLQAFPDGWCEFGLEEDGTIAEISDTQQYKMMGNAITTIVAQRIIEKLYGI